jgi:plastocyanin
MRRRSRVAVALVAAAWITYAGTHAAAPITAQAAGTGIIKGRIRLTGKVPGNPIIRMGVDPMCSRANAGKRLAQQFVVVGAEGGLANTVVQLDGALPAGPVPPEPVVINQKGCVYAPRVVTAQAGRTLRVINSDTLLHEVHTTNSRANEFKITQPQSGMVFNHPLKKEDAKNEDGVVRLACSVHSWMTAYVAVLPHAFADVTDDSGEFTIARVPPGKYTIRTWHERYGRLSKTVEVTAGGTSTVSFDYTGTEKPKASILQPLIVRS